MAGNSVHLQLALFLALLLMKPAGTCAQVQEALLEMLEEVAPDDEKISMEIPLLERITEAGFSIPDLNRATPDELEASGLFSSYQAMILVEYRTKYGPLISVYELAVIGGFRPEQCKEIAACFSVQTPPEEIHSRRSTVRSLIFVEKKFPDKYESPMKFSTRIMAGRKDELSIGLAVEKDAGEDWIRENGPQFTGACLQYKSPGVLEKLIIGRYHLQNGLGILNGRTSFVPIQDFHLSRPYYSRLSPYGGCAEKGIHQGLACKIRVRPFRLTLWASLNPLDLSLSKLDTARGQVDWLELGRMTGLYRTEGEIKGRGLAWLGNGGLQLEYSQGYLKLGIQFCTEGSTLSKDGKDSLKIDGGTFWHHGCSLHGRWQKQKLELFWEVATVAARNAGLKNSAIQAGARYRLNDFFQMGGLAYYYGAHHRESFAGTYASGSHVKNENGLLMHLRAEAAPHLTAQAGMAWWHHAAPGYTARVPSSGLSIQLILQNQGREFWQWKLRLRKKIREHTPQTQMGIRPLEKKELLSLDARLRITPSPQLHTSVRLLLSWKQNPEQSPEPLPAQAALLQIRTQAWMRIRCTLQFVSFRIPDWDLRMAIYEPGMYQHFSFPVYYGQGQKIIFMISLKVFKSMRLEARYSLLSDEEKIRHEAGIQVGLSF